MTYSPKVYIDLTSDGTPGWVDITTDVLGERIRGEYGIRSNEVTERIARTGQMELYLDNRSKRYSPNSTDALAGFDLGNRIKLVFEGDQFSSEHSLEFFALQDAYGSDITVHGSDWGWTSDGTQVAGYCTDAGFDSDGFTWTYASAAGYLSDGVLYRKIDTYCTDDGYDSDGFTWTYASDGVYDSNGKQFCTDAGYDSDGLTWTYAVDDGYDSDLYRKVDTYCTDDGYGSDGVMTVLAVSQWATDSAEGFDSDGVGTSDGDSDAIATDVDWTTNIGGVLFFSTDGIGTSNGVSYLTDAGFVTNAIGEVFTGNFATDNASDGYDSNGYKAEIATDNSYITNAVGEVFTGDFATDHTSDAYNSNGSQSASDWGANASDVPSYAAATDLVPTSNTIWTNSSDLPAACAWASDVFSTDTTAYQSFPFVSTDAVGQIGSASAKGMSFRNASDSGLLVNAVTWISIGSDMGTGSDYTFVPYIYAHQGTYGATNSYRGSLLATGDSVPCSNYTTTGTPSSTVFTFSTGSQFVLISNTPYIFLAQASPSTALFMMNYAVATNLYPGIGFSGDTNTPYDFYFEIYFRLRTTSTNASELASDFATDGFTASNVGAASNIGAVLSYATASGWLTDSAGEVYKVTTYATDGGYTSDGVLQTYATASGYITDSAGEVYLVAAYASDTGGTSNGEMYATDLGYSTSFDLHATDDGYGSDGFTWTYATDEGYDSDLWRMVATYCSDNGYDSDGFIYATDNSYVTNAGGEVRLLTTYCTDDVYDSDGFTWAYATDDGYDSDNWRKVATYCTDSSDSFDSNGFHQHYDTDAGFTSDHIGPGSDQYAATDQIGYIQTTNADLDYLDTNFGDGLFHAYTSDKLLVGSRSNYTSNGDPVSDALYSGTSDGGPLSLSFWLRVSSDETWVHDSDAGWATDTAYACVLDYQATRTGDTNAIQFHADIQSSDESGKDYKTLNLTIAFSTDGLTVEHQLIVATNWVNVIFVCTPSSSMTIYVDGQEAGVSTCMGVTSTDITGELLQLFGRSSDELSFVGAVAHLALYNRALTFEDAWAISQRKEFQRDCLYTLPDGPPTVYWQLGDTVQTLNVPEEEGLETANADTYTKFLGYLSSIEPEAGIDRGRVTKALALDWMDKANRQAVKTSPVMVDELSGAIVEALLAYTNLYPLDVSIDAGQNAFIYAGNSALVGTVLSGELNKLCRSEPGYIYLTGGAMSDGVVGELLVYEDRSSRQLSRTQTFGVDDYGTTDAMLSLSIERAQGNVYNVVKTKVYPTEVDASAVVIYDMTTDNTPIVPANDELVMYVEYSDSDVAFETVGAVDVIPPVRVTDYEIKAGSVGGADASLDLRAKMLATKSSDVLGYWSMRDGDSLQIREGSRYNAVADGGRDRSDDKDDDGVIAGSTFKSAGRMCVKPPRRWDKFK